MTSLNKLKKRARRRERKREHKRWVDRGWEDDHHILAKSRGGTKHPSNIIRMDRSRHEAFHFLFGNRTFLEAARVLVVLNDNHDQNLLSARR